MKRLQELYSETLNEPVPADMRELLSKLDAKKGAGEMGGKSPAPAPFAGGELAGH